MTEHTLLTDELIERAFRARMRHAPSTALLDRILDGASATPQDAASRSGLRGRLWPGARPDMHWLGLPSLVGAMALVLVVVFIGLSLRQPGVGPGASPSLVPSPTPSIAPSQSPSPGVSGPPTPEATTLGSFSARRLDLGAEAGPIAVTAAFDSIWVANIHADEVRRYDATTFAELARIDVPSAAWFAVADGALWVTNQTGSGLSRIDPQTNTVVANVGEGPPCGAPVVALGSLWQAACDANTILRIDPATNRVLDTIPAQGHVFLVFAASRLITVGSEGLATLDPDRKTFTPIANPAAGGAEFLASDGTTVWVKNAARMVRIDPVDGRTIASFSNREAQAVSFSAGHAWLSVRGEGVLEIDLVTNQVIRTIAVPNSPLVPVEADGALWVTDFDNSRLWRIDL